MKWTCWENNRGAHEHELALAVVQRDCAIVEALELTNSRLHLVHVSTTSAFASTKSCVVEANRDVKESVGDANFDPSASLAPWGRGGKVACVRDTLPIIATDLTVRTLGVLKARLLTKAAIADGA
jgi:hypothetical protein